MLLGVILNIGLAGLVALWVISCIFVFRSPRLINMGKVYQQTNLENLEQAFSVAEKDLGVTRLLDPEGKSVDKCVQTDTDNLFFFFFLRPISAEVILLLTNCW